MSNDLISRSEAKKLGATCLARRNENGQLEAIISLDNAPTVEPEKAKESELIKAYTKGFDAGVETVKNERPQVCKCCGTCKYEHISELEEPCLSCGDEHNPVSGRWYSGWYKNWEAKDDTV